MRLSPIACCLLLSAMAFQVAVGAATPAPAPEGAGLLKTDILGVFAHPDDETGIAATIARYARGQGKAVSHVYVTRGEGGGNMVGTQAGPALGILREVELRNCLQILGVRSCHFLDQTDFFYTESHAATLRKWDREEALRRLVRLVRSLRPEIIVTMNPAPNPGQHGHHQAAGVLATLAFTAAADPRVYPDQLKDEGLSVWQVRKLFYGGASTLHFVTIDTSQPLIEGRTPAEIAGQALGNHRSQAFGNFVNSPWLRRPQGFTLVKSVVAPQPASSDLFEGLPVADPAVPLRFAAEPLLPVLAFQARPAIRHFMDWSAEQGIRHVFASFPADLPVVAGEGTRVQLDVAPEALAAIRSSLRYQVPDGWQVEALKDGAPGAVVRVPADALKDVEIRATARYHGTEIEAAARLHPVPQARIPRVRRVPELGHGTAGWEWGALLEIGTNRNWQGASSSAADCSARVRVLHDGRQLLVRVEVQDDAVVSNIAPDDIKGHWRSDSVEICLDPAAGAEDTTGCFKVGIFPFDSSGRVRAARDADARQGPIEDTAPGLRIASERVPGGYRIDAAIPLSLVTGKKTAPRRLGFNVLIYDGDKADAAPGENINKTRLAWAPRSGVQGRPDDWGRIDLD